MLLAAIGIATPVAAADIAAGKAASEACAACHGANGTSVSDDIPNLAGQKAKYLETQLKAFRSGERKNELMNAIASQLKDADIANLVAYFNSQAGADGTDVSELVASIEATRVTFPADYKATYTKYTTISFENRKQVRDYYANEVALKAAKAGQPMPAGAKFLVEINAAKLDDAQKPVKGADGHLVAAKVTGYTAMETQPGWGNDIPAILRNADWNYAVFAADGALRTGVNQAKCLACHKPLTEVSYLFTLKELTAKATSN